MHNLPPVAHAISKTELESDICVPDPARVLQSNVGVFICDAGTGGAGSKIFKHVVFF